MFQGIIIHLQTYIVFSIIALKYIILLISKCNYLLCLAVTVIG